MVYTTRVASSSLQRLKQPCDSRIRKDPIWVWMLRLEKQVGHQENFHKTPNLWAPSDEFQAKESNTHAVRSDQILLLYVYF